MSKDQIERLEIHGHTDENGSIKYNEQLSEKRAKEVATILETHNHGIEVKLNARGELEPLSKDPVRNRRVEVYAYTKPQPLPREIKKKVRVIPDGSTTKASVGYNQEVVSEDGLKILYDENYVSIKEVTSVLTDESMLENGINAFDVSGRALISGGMAMIDFDNKMKDTVSISIPARTLDPNMKVYLAEYDAKGNVVWRQTALPLKLDSANGTYTAEVVVGSGVMGLNFDKPGSWTYVFNVPTDSFRSVAIDKQGVRFSGVRRNRGAVPVFTAEYKSKLKRTELNLSYYQNGKLKTASVKRSHFRRKKKGRTFSFTPKKRHVRKYDFVT